MIMVYNGRLWWW